MFGKSTVRFKCWWLSSQPCSWSSATRKWLNTQDSSLTPFRNHVLISITFDIGKPWATKFSSSVMSSASSCAAHVNSETPLFGTRQPLGMVTCYTQCLSTCTGAIQKSRKPGGASSCSLSGSWAAEPKESPKISSGGTACRGSCWGGTWYARFKVRGVKGSLENA